MSVSTETLVKVATMANLWDQMVDILEAMTVVLGDIPEPNRSKLAENIKTVGHTLIDFGNNLNLKFERGNYEK